MTDSPLERSPRDDKVAKALEAGHLWPAKEILSGRIRTLPFDADMYEQLGAVLLRMGDDLQAGRFLFLSGHRRPEYERPIDLFLDRYVRGDRGGLFAAFPRPLRRRTWSDLPAQVQAELEAARVSPSPVGAPLSGVLYRESKASWGGILRVLLVVIVFVILVSILIAYFLY